MTPEERTLLKEVEVNVKGREVRGVTKWTYDVIFMASEKRLSGVSPEENSRTDIISFYLS